MKKLLIENAPEELATIQKVDFDAVDNVFNALSFAFHPNGFGDDLLDERFISLWKLFLITSGWKEDDYWEEVELQSDNDVCEHCREENELEELENSSPNKEKN